MGLLDSSICGKLVEKRSLTCLSLVVVVVVGVGFDAVCHSVYVHNVTRATHSN